MQLTAGGGNKKKNKSAPGVFNPAAPERSAHVYRETKPFFFFPSEETISILNFGGLYSLSLSLCVEKLDTPSVAAVAAR